MWRANVSARTETSWAERLAGDDHRPSRRPRTDARDPATLVPDALQEVLRLAGTWLAWDGSPTSGDRNVWTPHKALRRVSDHLLDHLAEINALLGDAPTVADTWHGRFVTLDADWAHFTEVDLAEASSRLARFAELYRLRLTGLSTGELDRRRHTAWTIRQITHHVADVVSYARQVGDLSTHHAATNADADYVFTEWDRRTRAGDIDGLLELYAAGARFESPPVPRILDQASGVLRGHDSCATSANAAPADGPRRWSGSGAPAGTTSTGTP